VAKFAFAGDTNVLGLGAWDEKEAQCN